jgi:hypothetical protein
MFLLAMDGRHERHGSQRQRIRVAVICCLAFWNVPSTVARPALHRALPTENTWTVSVPSLRSKV